MQDYVAGVQQFVVDALFRHSHACSIVSVHCSLGAFSNDHLIVFSLAIVHAVLGSLLAWLKHPSLVFSVAVDHAFLVPSQTITHSPVLQSLLMLIVALLARLAPSRCCRCSSLSPCLLKRSLTRLFSKLSWWLRGWFVVVAAFSIESSILQN